jgi:hypothetical protein
LLKGIEATALFVDQLLLYLNQADELLDGRRRLR